MEMNRIRKMPSNLNVSQVIVKVKWQRMLWMQTRPCSNRQLQWFSSRHIAHWINTNTHTHTIQVNSEPNTILPLAPATNCNQPVLFSGTTAYINQLTLNLNGNEPENCARKKIRTRKFSNGLFSSLCVLLLLLFVFTFNFVGRANLQFVYVICI